MSADVEGPTAYQAPRAIALQADGRLLETAPHRLGGLIATPASTPIDVLRRLFQRDGYVWLKGLLDRQQVLDFRARVFAELHGLTQRGTPPRLGLANPTPPPKDKVNRDLMAFVRSAAFEGFCAQPSLVSLMDQFLGGLSYLHKRKILRHTLPQSGLATPAHYDLIYLRGGTDRVVTAWIPIGDTPAAMGGLCYLEGSHRRGVELEAEFSAKAKDLTPEERISAYNKNMTEGGWVSKNLPEMSERFDTRWLIADYEAGDVVLHSPYMIHASTTNEDPDGRIRLSTDIRYQNVHDEIDARWANHWSLDDML